jgi:YesN/AraC family two-component response regulator
MTELLNKLKLLSKNRTILIVEDDLEVQLAIKEMFGLFFKDIHTANDGKEGLDIIKSKKFDLIISDITMPHKNGIEMIKEAYEYNNELKFIVLSAHSDAEFLMPLIDMGVERFVHKPFDASIMINRVIDVLEHIISKELIDKQAREIVDLNKYLERKNQELAALSNTLETIVYDDTFDIGKFRESAKKNNSHHTPKEITNDTIIDLWLD